VFSSAKKFSLPDQCPCSDIAIKPDVRGVKQLDQSIDDTFVSDAREEVFFALIDFETVWMERSRMPHAHVHRRRYESIGNTIVQLRSPFSSG
jgi:hypothetical protein